MTSDRGGQTAERKYRLENKFKRALGFLHIQNSDLNAIALGWKKKTFDKDKDKEPSVAFTFFSLNVCGAGTGHKGNRVFSHSVLFVLHLPVPGLQTLAARTGAAGWCSWWASQRPPQTRWARSESGRTQENPKSPLGSINRTHTGKTWRWTGVRGFRPKRFFLRPEPVKAWSFCPEVGSLKFPHKDLGSAPQCPPSQETPLTGDKTVCPYHLHPYRWGELHHQHSMTHSSQWLTDKGAD